MNQDAIGIAIAGVMPAAFATGLFASLFTAQEPRPTQGPNGVIEFDYIDIAGLTNIPCTAPPESSGSIVATEMRELEEIRSSETHHVLLRAWYPQLDQGWRGENGDGKGAWIALIDGYQYQIYGVESDSQSQMTRVSCKLVTL